MPEEMTFQVNQSLLGEKYIDDQLGFSFSPPKGCTKMPSNMVEQVKGELNKYSVSFDLLVLEPKQFFLNEDERFICLLTKIPSLSLSDSSINFYQQVVENVAKDNTVQRSSYKYRDFLIYQNLIISKEMINFKLLIPQQANKSFQLDYIVPKPIYTTKIEVIESSIGSLLKNNNCEGRN